MEGCKKAVSDRVVNEMLGSVKDTAGGGWKVLILDQFTTRVLSSTLKMSDILECNVSVVEDLSKARQPMPLAAVYFIQPSSASVAQLIEDFTGRTPLYPSVHIFFSSKVPSAAVSKIKACPALISVLKTLKESNLEFLTVDSHTFVTDHLDAPAMLLGDQADAQIREGERELDSIASRLGTALATLNEFPVIRYRKGKTPEATDPPGREARATLTQRLAGKLLERADGMRQQGQLPDKETCDLIILDRSYDPVAPVIHEWTYESLVYDLLKMDGNLFRYQAEANGKSEEREVHLEEADTLWCELRHQFIADVYQSLGSKFAEFQSKNKAAKLGGGLKGEMSTASIRQLIVALPQFRDVLSKLSLHIQISSDLHKATDEHKLSDVGELEQDLVLGDKNSKDMVKFLTDMQPHMSTQDKIRLLMCYCATHPEKMDAEKKLTWSKAARLSPRDMMMVTNLALLGCQVAKPGERQEKSGSSFFGGPKKKEKPDLIRRKKVDDGGYALFRFEPLLKDILSDLAAGKLPTDQFPYVRAPSGDSDQGASSAAASARTGRTGLNWTRGGRAGEGTTSGPAGRRLLVFIIGGAVRSEMRVVHELSKSLKREVILASTSVETPTTFMEHLQKMNSAGVEY